jgi:predicted CXXCH cytochrome family protein
MATATVLSVISSYCFAQQSDDFGLSEVDPDLPAKIKKWNADCLSCHSEQGLINPPRQGMDMKLLATLLVKQDRFEHSDHGKTACKDCHTEAYVPYPHLPNARKQIKGCVECHQAPARTIVPEFKSSIHFKSFKDKFTCLSCHDSHTMRKASRLDTARQAASQDNAMCLSCHDDDAKYRTWKIDKKRPDMVAVHAWLPSLDLHLSQVRCIDCHAPMAETGALSHEVRTKDKAVRTCESCHGEESELGQRLYKRILIDKPGPSGGFEKAALLSEIYVVGVTRNSWGDWAALVCLIAAILAVAAGAYRRHNRRRKG